MFWRKKKKPKKEYEIVEVDLQDTIVLIELQDGTEVKRLFKGELVQQEDKIKNITGLIKAKEWYKEQKDFYEISEAKLIQKEKVKSLDLLVSKNLVKVFAEKGKVQPVASDEEWK